MAKRGKHIGPVHYEPKYKEAFKELIKGRSVEVEKIIDKKKNERPGTFLGFKLKQENVCQLWRWGTLENIS